MTSENKLLDILEKLRRNCHLGKHKHFFSAGRKKTLDLIFGISIMLINFFIAAIHLILIGQKMDYLMVYLISGISVVAVLLAGMELKYNFAKTFEAHRRIGNSYLVIARECEKYIADYALSLITLKQLSSNIIPELNKKYNEINTDAESFPTRKIDYNKAIKIQNAKENS